MADDKFQELITTGLLKLCPHCQTRTQKTEGEDASYAPVACFSAPLTPAFAFSCKFKTHRL